VTTLERIGVDKGMEKRNRHVSVQIYFTDGREKDCLGSMGTNIDCSARIVGDDIKV